MSPSLRFFSLFVAALLAATSALHAQNATPAPTVIESQELDMTSTDTETKSVFTGNVVLTGTNIRITCDRLEVIALRGGDPHAALGRIEAFKSLIATGNVRIIQAGREAAAGQAVVLPGEDKVTLTGNPVLKDNDVNTIFTGDPIVLHRGQRQVTGKNIRIIAPELRDLGVDRNKLLNAPAAPANPTPAQ